MPAVIVAGVLLYQNQVAKAAGPYFYACTPLLSTINAGGNVVGVFVYNPSATTATVSRKLLSKDGTNRSGSTNSGDSSTYPGEATGNSVSISATQSVGITWTQPSGSFFNAPADAIAGVKIVSDVPVIASFSTSNPAGFSQCNQIAQ